MSRAKHAVYARTPLGLEMQWFRLLWYETVSDYVNRNDLQELSRLRRSDAWLLLRNRHYAGSYYLAGYAVECALKACIAKRTRRYDFPDKNLAKDAWVHKLEDLIKLAELWPALAKEMKMNGALQLNWAVVKDWSEKARYDASISRVQAKNLYSACTARQNGILSWIRKRW